MSRLLYSSPQLTKRINSHTLAAMVMTVAELDQNCRANSGSLTLDVIQ